MDTEYGNIMSKRIFFGNRNGYKLWLIIIHCGHRIGTTYGMEKKIKHYPIVGIQLIKS